MEVSYNKLWHLLIDKNLKKTEMARNVHMSYSTLEKLVKNQPVKREVLERIAKELDCEVEDIMETKKEKKERKGKSREINRKKDADK